MKNRWSKRRELQRLLYRETGCAIQHTGWPCNTCFHAMEFKGVSQGRLHELWQSTLLIRGDYSDLIHQDDETLTKNVDELLELLR